MFKWNLKRIRRSLGCVSFSEVCDDKVIKCIIFKLSYVDQTKP